MLVTLVAAEEKGKRERERERDVDQKVKCRVVRKVRGWGSPGELVLTPVREPGACVLNQLDASRPNPKPTF